MTRVSAEEVKATIDWISSIQDGDGPGTTRLLYTPSWVQAQNEFKEKFEALGMTVEFDDVGNLFATMEGSEEPDSIIATGSHIDTVVEGGPLDGQLGVSAGYLAAKYLIENYGQPKKSLRVISMAEEEGSRFPYAFWGSKNIFGLAKREEVEGTTDQNGVKFEAAMEQSGFQFPSGDLKFKDMDAFIELHIEQGNFLEKAEKQVGIVTAIVGQKRYDIHLKGQANHAGTTMMEYRHDTIECMSRIISQSIDKAKAVGNPLVLTFGRVENVPNTVNVVPGETTFSMDCRHTDQEALDNFTSEIEADMREIAESMGIEIEINQWMDEEPVPMDKGIVDLLEQVSEDLELNYQVMHSGAGHDSQIIAKHVPTAMIFVPSVDGISHNPQEYTSPEDCAQGVEALLEALKRLAY
ncbi:allantoate deiminase [Hutsoniella sourekii]|uniref:allantoate deiminase n=1 Tax=Hutsoniella sourekii TaxID=87650 RepID=UPI000481AACF|nr:allantoate deiminase [Hutsoniella sourekii]